MSRIEARILAEDELDTWDQLVRRSEQGSVFHSSKWITLSAKSLRSDYAIIGVFNDSELIGGCFFYIKTLFSALKIGYTTTPLMPWGGFVLSPPQSSSLRAVETREREIVSLILEKIKTLDLFHVKIVNSPAFRDIRPIIWGGWTECVYYTYVRSLENDIFLSFPSNTRTNIRKAQKQGITVSKEYNPDLYWKLNELTYGKQNMKILYQKEYLVNLMEMLNQNNLGAMWIAKMSSGEAASAIFTIDDTPFAHSWVGANDPRFKNTGVTSLLELETYKDLQMRGFRRVSLMGANFQHLAKFYSEFNPHLVPYYGVRRTKGIQRLLNLLR
jgi:lipid II:glycine glycyltransferase (peptidoglycan interpeptide bridge formation enzyme)